MRQHRIYYPFIAQLHEKLVIENEKAHYLQHVLRLKAGREIKIFNQLQHEYLAVIREINKKHLVIELMEAVKTTAISKLNITLVQGLSKGERMDYSVQKATELGVTTIVPIISEYCEVKLKGNRLQKRLKHWQNIAISACEQSFRVDIPKVLAPIAIVEYCNQAHQGLLLEPKECKTLAEIAKENWQQFDIVIGPEGGWSQRDLKLLKSSGLLGVKFGSRILRTETMAPALLGAIHSLWGDFI